MAGKKRARNRKSTSGLPPKAAVPKVHVKVALADTSLRSAAALVKPAILYADDVTIYSPAASMLSAVRDMGRVRDPRDQIALTLTLAREVPQLREQMGASDEMLEQLSTLLAIDRRQLDRVARSTGASSQLSDLDRILDGFADMWALRMPEAIDATKDALEADELLIAIEAGSVKVADLLGDSATSMIADSLRLATGAPSITSSDGLVHTFFTRLVELLTEPRTFPLFDAQSSGLIRAFEATLDSERSALPRANEVAAAATFMGYLPCFTSMPMDEVIDLRGELKVPLVRFRGAVSRLSRDFESRAIDEGFDLEVEGIWRREVEPALVDIREALAEHGLLREIASVALGDPRRLLLEAGGVVAAAHGRILSLSSLLTGAVAAGLPTLDVVGRAALSRGQGRRQVKSNAFCFLHRVAHDHQGGP